MEERIEKNEANIWTSADNQKYIEVISQYGKDYEKLEQSFPKKTPT